MIDRKKLNPQTGNEKKGVPEDPNFTPEVKNPKVEELLKLYGEEKTGENLHRLVEVLGSARLLMPANLNKEKQVIPCLIDAPNGEKLLSAYTCLERIPKVSKHMVVVNMAFPAICEMATRPQGPDRPEMGIILNPFTDNLVFTQSLLQKIKESEEQQSGGVGYEAAERRKFEMEFLPGKFFEGGKSMVEEICEKKEEYIDQLFEEAYEQKRRYPYLPEEFSVMVINIAEDLLMVRVELPNRDIGERYCEHLYFAWNELMKSGRYFYIERKKGSKERSFGEISAGGSRIDYGEAPVEGTELSRIIDLIGEIKS